MSFLCPVCRKPTFVKDTRWRKSKNYLTRRRECNRGHRCTTYEILVGEVVAKRGALKQILTQLSEVIK